MADLRITISGPQGCGKSRAADAIFLLRGCEGSGIATCDLLEQENHEPHPQDRIAHLEAVNARLMKGLLSIASLLPPPDITDAAGVRRAFHDPNAAQHLLIMRDAYNKAMKPDA